MLQSWSVQAAVSFNGAAWFVSCLGAMYFALPFFVRWTRALSRRQPEFRAVSDSFSGAAMAVVSLAAGRGWRRSGDVSCFVGDFFGRAPQARARMRRGLLFAGYLLAALLLSHWFFHSGVLSKVDTLFHLNRVMGIAAGLAAGDFPVYLHGYQMQGFGTADGVLYPDLLLYVPALLVVCGVPLAAAYHAYWVLVVFLGLAAAWRGYTLVTGRAFVGLLAALLFSSSYFLLFCLGASVGAYVAISFLPYVFGALYALLRQPRGARAWPELVLAFTVIAESHVINTLFFLLAAPFCVFAWRRGLSDKARRRGLWRAVLFSLLVNGWRLAAFAFFYARVDFHIRHPFFASLAIMTSDAGNLFAAQFWWGWPLCLLAAAAVLARAFRRRRLFLLTLAFCVFLTSLIWSGFPWRTIERVPGLGHVLEMFQFSMRLLPLGLLPLAFFLARYLAVFCRTAARRLGAGCAGRAAALLLALGAVAYGLQAAAQTAFTMGGVGIRWQVAYEQVTELPSFGPRVQPDYLYADVEPEALFASGEVPAPGEVRAVAGEAAVSSFAKRGTRLSFAYVSPAGAEVQVPLFFYPGYQAWMDGAPLAAAEGAHHVLTLSLPAGAHEVSVRYTGPWFFRASALVSLASLMVFLFLWACEWRRAHA